jgi:hypothetical protein
VAWGQLLIRNTPAASNSKIRSRLKGKKMKLKCIAQVGAVVLGSLSAVPLTSGTASAGIFVGGADVSASATHYTGSYYNCSEGPLFYCFDRGHRWSITVKDVSANSRCAGAEFQHDLSGMSDPLEHFWNCSGNGTTRQFSPTTKFRTPGDGHIWRATKIAAVEGTNGLPVLARSGAVQCNKGLSCNV